MLHALSLLGTAHPLKIMGDGAAITTADMAYLVECLVSVMGMAGVKLTLERWRGRASVETTDDHDPEVLAVALSIMDYYDHEAIPEDEDPPELTEDGVRVHFTPEQLSA